MGRKCKAEEKKRSTHLHIRMTVKERDTLKRVANHFNKNDTYIVMNALNWYYAQMLNDKEYECLIRKGAAQHDANW